MNKIKCSVTTPKHREIAEKLGLPATVITNLFCVLESKGNTNITEDDIRKALSERKEVAKEMYLAIPDHTVGDTVKDGIALAYTKSSTGKIILNNLPKENPMGYFFDYIQGNKTQTPASQQKQVVFERLIKQGELESLDELKEILSNPYEAYQFLLWHEMSHKQNNDVSQYWLNGKDLMTADKIDIEYRATLDALNKAREYRKQHPITNKTSKEVTFTTSQTTSYPSRTRENAEWSDVTIAVATDFTTAGEKLTKKVAGDKYIEVSLPKNEYGDGVIGLRDKDNPYLAGISQGQRIAKVQELSKKFPQGIKLNIAGNGVYTFVRNGATQEQVNTYMEGLLTGLRLAGVKIITVRSGGQTGSDEAGIIAALKLGIPAQVHATSNWMYRDANGRDISDEATFKARFAPAKQFSEQEVETTPTIGNQVKGVKVNTDNPILKINAAFTPQQRRDRVKMIAEMFEDEVTGALEELKDSTQQSLEETTAMLEIAVAQGDWVLQKQIEDSQNNANKLLQLLEDPVKGRQQAIQTATVKKIVENIKEQLLEMLDYSDSEYERLQYKNMLDNFDYLLDEATFTIEQREHLKLAIEKGTEFLGKEANETIQGTVTEVNADIEENGREQDDDDEEGTRATGNDGWSFKVRMVDPHNSLSKTTKRILSNLIKLDNVTGEPELDDLGRERKLDEQYAHTVLLNHLSDLIGDDDFCKKEVDDLGNISYTFPALERLVGKYRWVQQVINELTNNPKEVSAFYADFRKDFIPYWKSKEVTEIVDGKEVTLIKSIPLNQPTGFESAKNQFIDNYRMGTLITDHQIYNSSGKLIADNIAFGKKLLDDIDLLELDDLDEDLLDEICENLAKTVKMLGLDINKQAIKNVWDLVDGDKNIRDLYNALTSIYEQSKKLLNKDGAHLISECNQDFNKLSSLLAEVTAMDAIGSFRNGDKTYYSYSAPNYINTQLKTLKSDAKRQDYLDSEFKPYEWFYDSKTGRWKGSTENDKCWLDLIESDEDVRDHLEIRELLAINKEVGEGDNKKNEDIDYTNWTPLDIKERFITEYFSVGYNAGSKNQYGYYNFPIFSDSPVAMMIKFIRYTDNFEGEIIPRLRQVVKQELERIKLVEERAKVGASPIACFDGDRGRSFCFFPYLGQWDSKSKSYKNGLTFASEDGSKQLSFRDKVAELKSQGMEAVDYFIDQVLSEHMQEESEDFIRKYASVGEKLVEVGIAENEADAENKLREYFYNHEYAETQIIQMTTTDLAFYKDGTDFQKRYKEVYASGTKLNTQSQYGREFEKTLYLSDLVITSAHYLDIKSALTQAKEKWIERGMDAKVAQMTVDDILNKFRNITVTDAQAYRSLSSFRAVLDMMGLWDDNMQNAFDRIQNGEWDIADFNVVWQTIKPFVYTQIGKESGVNNSLIKAPHQNKNSEFLLLSMYQMIAQSINKSPQLVALNKFMEDHGIDVIQFESAVKSGKQGCVDITYSENRLQDWIKNNPKDWDKIRKAYAKENGEEALTKTSDFEIFKEGNDLLLDDNNNSIGQQEYQNRMSAITPKTQEEVTLVLNSFVLNEDGSFNNDVIHQIPYRDYMIAQPTPEHLFDKNGKMAEAVFGSQFRNLIVADIDPAAVLKVNGREYTKDLILDLYNSLIVENLLDDFKEVRGRFSNIEDLQKAILDQVRGNAKYGRNILDSLQLVDWTDPNTGEVKKVFNIPLYSPSITLLIQEIVDSMFKSAVTKQKIKGAACTLVSNFGFTSQLNIIYNKEGDKTSGIKYAECYLPWYSKDHFAPFLKEKTDENGNTYQELDLKEIPSNLLEMVGYRIPTEDKYSMIPLKVVGFLPQLNGSSIMLPADITQMAGSDFDVDKLFMMMPEYRILNYDMKRAKADFDKANQYLAKIIDPFLKSITSEEDIKDAPNEFKEWFNTNKEAYKLDTPEIVKIKYKHDKPASQQSREARNNMLIDISRSILLNQDTADKLLNPGSFDKLKQAERISTIMGDSRLLRAYARERGLKTTALDLTRQDTDVVNFDTVAEMQQEEQDYNKAILEEVKAIRESLKKEELKSLEKFLKKYKLERDPLSLDTFIYNHQQNMTGGTLIGMYANNTTMLAKFQDSGISLRVIPADEKRGFSGIDRTFTIDGHLILKLDLTYSSWGERISKNCAEFSAASVDNVKDPVLAGLMQNKNTANIAGFMVRAGIPINIIGLMFTQPIIANCIRETGGLKYKDLKKRLPKDFTKNHISITTDELMDTIILQDRTSDTAAKIASLMLSILKSASDLSDITQVSRADSPNGAIASSIGAARNQVLKVQRLIMLSQNNSFSIAGVGKAVMRNDKVKSADTVDDMREKLMKSTMPRLQAFYSLGIELPLLIMSPFFVQLNSNVDLALQGIYSQSERGILEDTLVDQFYKDFMEYMLTESPLFGNDSEQTFDEKRDYYLYKFPSDYYAKRLQPKFQLFNILKKIGVLDGVIEMKRSGRLMADMKEAFTTDFDLMITSTDPEIVQMAKDLFMYSFYKNGYYFGPNSFGNFFSPLFMQSFPEFINTLYGILDKVETMDMNNFVSQFYNNYWREFVKEIKNTQNMFGTQKIVKTEPGNPNSDIMIPYKDCVNPMTGANRNPYTYILVDGDLYYLKDASKTSCTYYKVLTFRDEQGKKYNAAQSIVEMAENQTAKELIDTNKRVGAKKMSFDEIEAMMAAMDSLADIDMDAFMDMEGQQFEDINYDFGDSIDQLDKPLCTTK